MRTFPAVGSGISSSTNSQSPFGLLICAAFIFLFMKNLHEKWCNDQEAAARTIRTKRGASDLSDVL
jgi:hypothetical protein